MATGESSSKTKKRARAAINKRCKELYPSLGLASSARHSIVRSILNSPYGDSLLTVYIVQSVEANKKFMTFCRVLKQYPELKGSQLFDALLEKLQDKAFVLGLSEKPGMKVFGLIEGALVDHLDVSLDDFLKVLDVEITQKNKVKINDYMKAHQPGKRFDYFQLALDHANNKIDINTVRGEDFLPYVREKDVAQTAASEIAEETISVTPSGDKPKELGLMHAFLSAPPPSASKPVEDGEEPIERRSHQQIVAELKADAVEKGAIEYCGTAHDKNAVKPKGELTR